LFDAGNTLVFLEAERALEVLEPFGAPREPAAFLAAEKAARLHLTDLLSRPVPAPESRAWRGYFTTLITGLGIEPPRRRKAGRTLWEAHVEEHMWTRTDPATPQALQRLLDEGYRLGVVSNADGRMPDLMKTVGLARYFEFVVDSYVVGFEKPDPRIFGVATGRLGLRPDECLYVGDLYAVDVVGSRAAGMRSVLVDPFDGGGHLDSDVDRIPAVPDLPDWLARR
jgi:putative hydrolase of the HAD superfamily